MGNNKSRNKTKKIYELKPIFHQYKKLKRKDVEDKMRQTRKDK